MFLVKLAIKNLTRHKRRTFVTASVIAFGLFMYILVDSMMVGLEDMSFQNIIDMETGHIQLTTSAYWDEREELPLHNMIKLDEEITSLIEAAAHVQGTSPRLKFQANLNNGIDELPIIAVGINPEMEKEVLKIGEYMIEGSMFSLSEHQAVLGKSLADLMELGVGDYLTLLVRTKDGTFNTIEAEIVGLLNTTHPTINDSMVFVPLDLAQKALNLEGNVSEIIIRLNKEVYTEDVVAGLNESFQLKRPELKAQTWKESARDMIAMSEAQNVENSVIISIILILAAVGIINTVILSALERMEETGMMKAMGMREREIVFVYVMEAAGIGLLGGVIGIALGAIGTLLMVTFGIDLNWFGMGGFDWGIPIMDKFYGGWSLQSFVFSFSFGFIVALLSSILPARWAARKDPIEAIYHRGR